MFEGCASCSSDVCEKCLNDDWILTNNGCYEGIGSTSSKASTPLEQHSSSNGGDESFNYATIIGIALVALAVIAVIIITVFGVSSCREKRRTRYIRHEEEFPLQFL